MVCNFVIQSHRDGPTSAQANGLGNATKHNPSPNGAAITSISIPTQSKPPTCRGSRTNAGLISSRIEPPRWGCSQPHAANQAVALGCHRAATLWRKHIGFILCDDEIQASSEPQKSSKPNKKALFADKTNKASQGWLTGLEPATSRTTI